MSSSSERRVSRELLEQQLHQCGRQDWFLAHPHYQPAAAGHIVPGYYVAVMERQQEEHP